MLMTEQAEQGLLLHVVHCKPCVGMLLNHVHNLCLCICQISRAATQLTDSIPYAGLCPCAA